VLRGSSCWSSRYDQPGDRGPVAEGLWQDGDDGVDYGSCTSYGDSSLPQKQICPRQADNQMKIRGVRSHAAYFQRSVDERFPHKRQFRYGTIGLATALIARPCSHATMLLFAPPSAGLLEQRGEVTPDARRTGIACDLDRRSGYHRTLVLPYRKLVDCADLAERPRSQPCRTNINPSRCRHCQLDCDSSSWRSHDAANDGHNNCDYRIDGG
jgi:hypothetical protein